MIEHALNYVRQGIPVFPLQPNGKIPLVAGGFKAATTNKEQVELWWKNNPKANIGIPTGQASGFTVIDVDRHGDVDGYTSLGLLQIEPPELTHWVRTANDGAHLYYRYSPELEQTAGLLPGIDVRNDGGYVIGVGSVIDDRRYILKNDVDPLPLPQWALDAQAARKPTNTPSGSDSRPDEVVMEGGRNHYLTSIGGTLRKQGLTEDAIYGALVEINNAMCEPPLAMAEVITISESVSRYTPGVIYENDPLTDPTPASTIVKANSLIGPMIEYLNDKDRVKGEPTGIEALDHLLGGGFRTGEVTALHAEAKTGKNTLLHKIIYHKLEEGYPIAYASRELTPETEVLPNLLSLKLRKNMWTSEAVSDELAPIVNPWPLYFAHGYGFFPLEEVVKWFKDCKDQHGVELFVLDHLHYMLEEPEDHKAASKLIKQIKTLAKQLDVHVIIIIQPNKLMEGQHLSQGTIKGGSAIGQAIDNLLTYERDRGDRLVGRLKLSIARSKLARLGDLYLKYDPITTDLIEVERAPDPQPVEIPGPLSHLG